MDQEKWYTLEECYEQSGKQFPFYVVQSANFTNLQNTHDSNMIISKDDNGWFCNAKWYWSTSADLRKWQLNTNYHSSYAVTGHSHVITLTKADLSKFEIIRNCTCDFHTVLLPYGCKCGGK